MNAVLSLPASQALTEVTLLQEPHTGARPWEPGRSGERCREPPQEWRLAPRPAWRTVGCRLFAGRLANTSYPIDQSIDRSGNDSLGRINIRGGISALFEAILGADSLWKRGLHPNQRVVGAQGSRAAPGLRTGLPACSRAKARPQGPRLLQGPFGVQTTHVAPRRERRFPLGRAGSSAPFLLQPTRRPQTKFELSFVSSVEFKSDLAGLS